MIARNDWQAFVDKWKRVNQTERATAQSHFIDLCQTLGQPTPTDADQDGTTYAFEKGATKSGGGVTGKAGWADVWKRNCFAWEYKKKHADLTKAYDQLQLYRESLENPPLLIVSDLQTIEIHTNFTGKPSEVYRISLDDLLQPRKNELLRRAFADPYSFEKKITTAEVTEQAAREFARLAEILRAQGAEPGQAAHFLIRLLFCLFAEDIGLLPPDLFSRLVRQTNRRPLGMFSGSLRQLFEAMRTGGMYGSDLIPYFNGGLFDDDSVITFQTNEPLEVLERVSKLDWSNIEPAIFGTLFERSLDPGKRSQLGAHYTSKDDILLIVEPVLMDPLRRQWATVRAQAEELAARRDNATGGPRTRLEKELTALLTGFFDEIAAVRVLDPACGSGNFLYVSLKQLLDLQKEVVVLAAELGLSRFIPGVGPQQLYGIEVNEYAHELAQITIWIGYIQWLRDNGFGLPAEPILKPIKTIFYMDAIVAYGDNGQPHSSTWPQADVVIGNPPFLGGKRLRTELGDKYIDDLFKAYDNRVPREADLVCYWFEKARELVASGKVERVGLLATNSIRGGANRRVLERIKETGNIFMAWDDRPWVLEGAAVRVSIVGFDNGKEPTFQLNSLPVTAINPDLTASLNLTIAKRLQENTKLAFMGDTKVGPFDIDNTLAQKMLAAKGNPNGRPNSDVIFPWINGLDITRRPREMWIIDFGIDMSEEDAALYEAPFEYAVQKVKPFRAKAKSGDKTGIPWWIHQRPRPDLRAAIKPLARYIVTPRVSKYRLFVWVEPNVIPDSATIGIARQDDYFFGVLHSKLHEMWALRKGTWLGVGNDPRYTPTSTFETFPFPWSPGTEPGEADSAAVRAIAEAARRLVELRDNWLNPPDADAATLKKRTLTNLYNERPTWLANAHRKLDEAVLAAYGWPTDLSDEQILERLLALNLQRAAGQGALPAPAPETDEADGDEDSADLTPPKGIVIELRPANPNDPAAVQLAADLTRQAIRAARAAQPDPAEVARPRPRPSRPDGAIGAITIGDIMNAAQHVPEISAAVTSIFVAIKAVLNLFAHDDTLENVELSKGDVTYKIGKGRYKTIVKFNEYLEEKYPGITKTLAADPDAQVKITAQVVSPPQTKALPAASATGKGKAGSQGKGKGKKKP